MPLKIKVRGEKKNRVQNFKCTLSQYEQKARVFQTWSLATFCRNDIPAQVSADSVLTLDWETL